MKLLIISHTPHIEKDGLHYGWGPTVKEINFLANYFDVEHIAPIHRLKDIPKSFVRTSRDITIIPTRDRGGKTILAKLRVLVDSFEYLALIISRLKYCDLVHVRCPSNISLVGLFLLVLFPGKPKWIKYAGDWRPRQDYISYWIQRLLIKYFIRNQVATINDLSERNKSIFHFFNPSYFERDIAGTEPRKAPLTRQINILFVGGLTKNKGADLLIEAIVFLLAYLDKSIKLNVHIVGDGPDAVTLKGLTQELGLASIINFEGWKSGDELRVYYRDAHFVVLPSRGEGWPKVISEALVHGAVPIVSNVSSMKEVLHGFGVGLVVESFKPQAYADAIKGYILNPSRWALESAMALKTAPNFTYEHWAQKLFGLFEKHLGLRIETNSPALRVRQEIQPE